MKRFQINSLAATCIAIAVSLLAFAGTTRTNATPAALCPAASKGYGNSLFKGSYGFSYSEAIGGLGSITGNGAMTSDGNDNRVRRNVAATASDSSGVATTTFIDALVLHALVLANNGELPFVKPTTGIERQR